MCHLFINVTSVAYFSSTVSAVWEFTGHRGGSIVLIAYFCNTSFTWDCSRDCRVCRKFDAFDQTKVLCVLRLCFK